MVVRKESEEKSGFFTSVVEHFLIHAWMGIATRTGGSEKKFSKQLSRTPGSLTAVDSELRRESLVEAMKDDSTGPDSRAVVSWAVAVLLAAAALIGVVSVLAVIVWAVGDVPGWVTLVLGGGLALGATAFAWMLARALRARD
jgi:hypothetical protein